MNRFYYWDELQEKWEYIARCYIQHVSIFKDKYPHFQSHQIRIIKG